MEANVEDRMERRKKAKRVGRSISAKIGMDSMEEESTVRFFWRMRGHFFNQPKKKQTRMLLPGKLRVRLLAIASRRVFGF